MTLFGEPEDKKPVKKKKTFSERVVELALKIPSGKVTSYGALAKAAGGGSMASRSVSAILGKAWDKGEHGIPWHRIVYADGRVWFNPNTKKQRLALYKKEKIQLDKTDHIVDFQDKLHEF